jgi:hypothetical protein
MSSFFGSKTILTASILGVITFAFLLVQKQQLSFEQLLLVIEPFGLICLELPTIWLWHSTAYFFSYLVLISS